MLSVHSEHARTHARTRAMYMYGDMMHPNKKTTCMDSARKRSGCRHARLSRVTLEQERRHFPNLWLHERFAGISIISRIHALNMCASLTGGSDTSADTDLDGINTSNSSKDTNNAAVILDNKLSRARRMLGGVRRRLAASSDACSKHTLRAVSPDFSCWLAVGALVLCSARAAQDHRTD